MSSDFDGPVTVLFTDVEASTELRTRWGDQASQEILRDHEELVRRQVSEHDGREVKSLGDGFMVAFRSARKAVACAVAIQEAIERYGDRRPDRRIRLRIGLNTGEVISEDGDLFGEAVHAAARIAARAKGGQILAASVVRELAGTVPSVSFRDRGRVQLKGFPERRQLYEILWERHQPPPVTDRTPFVARESERAELIDVLEKALAGRGGLILIGGEPGVGKTRLAQELVDEGARRGMLTLVGHCYDTDTAPPYVAFVEVLEAAAKGAARSEALREALGDVAGEVARIVPELRRIFPDIPPPTDLPPDQERRYLFNSIAEFLERAGRLRPQLIVVDDLHWADEPTLFLIQHLAERLDQIPVLIIGTYRDVELDVARPLARTLEELLRRRLAHRMSLKRLSEAGVGQMLHALANQSPPPSLVRVLHEETDGNPFFVEEVFKFLREEGKLFDEHGGWRSDVALDELDVPEGVRLVVGRRLERLSEDTRRVLAAAAVIGRAFGYPLLEALDEVDADLLLDCIDEAERAHLISSSSVGAEDRLMFAHELIRQTLLTGVSAPRRRRTHVRVAEAMERVYAGRLEEHAADIAHHLEQAGASADPAQTVRYLSLAGDAALEAAAFEDALRYFENALSLHPSDEIRGRAELLYRLGLAQRSLGDISDGLGTWRESLALFEQLDDRARIAELCMEISLQLAWASLWPEALEMAARGVQSAGDEATDAKARLLGLSAILLAHTGEYGTATSLVEQAYALAEKLDDPVLIGYGKLTRALVHHAFCELEPAVELGLDGAQVLRNRGELWDLASFLGFMQFALFFLGRWDEAEELAQELEPLSRRIGHLGALIFALRSRPIKVFLSSDLEGIRGWIDNDLELSREVGPLHLSQALVFRGVLRFWEGEWEEAERDLVEALQVQAPGFWWQLSSAYLLLLRAYAGKGDEAMEMIAEQQDNWPQPGRPNHWGAWSLLLCGVEACHVVGRKEQAAAMYPLVLECRKTGIIARGFDLRLVETLAGLSAAAGGEWEVAEDHFRAALARAEELGLAREQLDVRRFHGEMLLERDAQGDRQRAEALLSDAVSGYRRLGLPKHEEIAEKLLSDV